MGWMMVVADTSSSSAPWWGTALIAGGFLVLGVLATLFGNWLMDRSRMKRGVEQQNRDRSFEACIDFLDAVYRFGDFLTRTHPFELSETNDRIMRDHQAAIVRHHVRVEITSAPTVAVVASQIFHEVIRDRHQSRIDDLSSWLGFMSARMANAVRADFGIKSPIPKGVRQRPPIGAL
jgi:hypothetical protein